MMLLPTVTIALMGIGSLEPSALLRALLANTATDLGRPGPDFQFGYGLMNAEPAGPGPGQGSLALG